MLLGVRIILYSLVVVVVGCGINERATPEAVASPDKSSVARGESDIQSKAPAKKTPSLPTCSTGADALPKTIALMESDVSIDEFSPWVAGQAEYIGVYETAAGDSSYRLELRKKSVSDNTVEASFNYDQGFDDPSNQKSLRRFSYASNLCTVGADSYVSLLGEGRAPQLVFVTWKGKPGVIAEATFYEKVGQ